MEKKKVEREWNIKEEADIAKASYEKRPAWLKSISHFSGTNTAPIESGNESVPSPPKKPAS